MRVLKVVSLGALKDGTIPLLVSANLHTSLILVLALCVSGEHNPSRSTHSATLGNSLADLDDVAIAQSIQIEFAESDSASEQADEDLFPQRNFARDVSVQLKDALSLPKKYEVVRTDFVSFQKPANLKTKIVPVSESHRSISFGRKDTFGSKRIFSGPTSLLEVVVEGLDPLGTKVLNDAGNLSLTGGAMMVSTALPSPALANRPLQFNYDESKEDGRRLVVFAGAQSATFPIHDWELSCLAKFVASGHHGAVSITMLDDREVVSLDAAFEQNLLGLRFIQADLMPRGIIISQEFLPQDEHGILVGPGEQSRLSSEGVVSSASIELRPLMKKTRYAAPYSVLTDAGIRFVFEFNDAELVVSGTPYFFFWKPAKNSNRVDPIHSINQSLRDAWPTLKKSNPLVIECMERSFRTVALFRYFKKHSPADWDSFVQQLPATNLCRISTPAFLTN